MHGMHTATSKVENSAQGSSCKLKFVHGLAYICTLNLLDIPNNVIISHYQNIIIQCKCERHKRAFNTVLVKRCILCI